ncbi:hypothetical protein V3W47_09395 [Deinococcus sp. YIM 134068]|uniref:hypothetical protein n=1 Tax=Deinococcus lichenicola TaxID=3118910 RepID=UPI002F945404
MNKPRHQAPARPRLALLSALLLGVGAAVGTAGTSQAQGTQAQTAEIKYSGPLVITKGGTYRGNWESLDPGTPAVGIMTNEPVVIEYSNIRSRGPLIRSRYRRANVTVRHTRGVGLNPGLPASARQTPGYFLHLEDFESATVENNEMVGTSGMYFHKYLGSRAKGQTVRIVRNRARNIDGRYSDGPNSFSDTGFYRVQFAQFNDVKNISRAEIAWNEIINEPGKSRVEEVINMYVSSGTPASPIAIHDNYIQGAYPTRAATAKFGGGGIMLGDGSASTREGASAYLRAYRNQIVGTSNQGIAIAAGHNIEAYDNRVISSGLLPDGTPIASQNVGIYVWDLHGDQRRQTFFNNSMRNNVVGWARPLQSPTAQNPFWFPHCARCAGNTRLPGPITLETEAQEYTRWQQKVRAANVTLGPGQE